MAENRPNDDASGSKPNPPNADLTDSELPESDEEWREVLEPDAYRVLREAGTEPRFSGDHLGRDEDGTYRCRGCGAPVFQAEAKYDSSSGWPSFAAGEEETLVRVKDQSAGMNRVEVRCGRCDGHLGHVFQDGPEPTGERFCINSVALEFDPDEV